MLQQGLRFVRDSMRTYLRRENDTHQEMLRKEVLVVVMSLGSVSCALWALIGYLISSPIYYFSGIGGTALFSGFSATICLTKRCSEWFMLMCLIMGILFTSLADIVLVADWNFRAVGLFILVADLLLVLELPPRAAKIVVAFIAFHILIVHSEITFRFGLFDFPGAHYEHRTSICTCEEPPCSTGVTWVTFASLLVVVTMFFLNFTIVHSFAASMREESAKVAAAIAQAERVASFLAEFDLAAAEASLVTHGAGLPKEMLRALETLLYNLGTYRPYLPQSCIEHTRSRYDEDMSDESDEDSSDEPGVGSVVPSCDDVKSRTDSTHTSTRRFMNSQGCVESAGSRSSSPRSLSSSSRMSPTNSKDGPEHPPSSSKASSVMVDVRKGSSHASEEAGSPSSRLRTNYLNNKRISLITLRATWTVTPFLQPHEFIEQHSHFLSSVLKNVVVNKGVVDSLMGDKIVGSFNAMARACRFAANGLKALQSLANDVEVNMPQAKVTGSILGGLAAVGILGTSDMRRPMIFTDLHGLADKLLRYCSMRNFSWLANQVIFGDTNIENRLRIVMDTVLLDFQPPTDGDTKIRHSRAPTMLYEVLTRRAPLNSPHSQDSEASWLLGESKNDNPDEWMYEMEKAVGKEWEGYNNAGGTYHRVGPFAALSEMDTAIENGTATVYQRNLLCDAIQHARSVDFMPVVQDAQKDDDFRHVPMPNDEITRGLGRDRVASPYRDVDLPSVTSSV